MLLLPAGCDLQNPLHISFINTNAAFNLYNQAFWLSSRLLATKALLDGLPGTHKTSSLLHSEQKLLGVTVSVWGLCCRGGMNVLFMCNLLAIAL